MGVTIKAESTRPTLAPRTEPSQLQLGLRQIRRNLLASIGLVILIVMVVVAILAPWLAPSNPIRMALANKLLPPGSEYFFGTDHYGRDVFSRVIYGTRVSLVIGVIVVTIALAGGVPIGVLAGYAGGGG